MPESSGTIIPESISQPAKPLLLIQGLGQSLAIVANRVSYVFGLHGPSMALDTSCSSSLVAVHMACQSIRAGESKLALAGGVNVLLSPETMIALTKFGGLSPDSRSKAFDAAANGFARGEGGGAVVLKLLSEALADGDPIYCVIRGSAVNNDGASKGLSAPSVRAQEMVLRDACADAGIDPLAVQYVEAHGTGTALGDPIEASALGSVYGKGRAEDAPLLIGSVKTNIGHLEGAAGIAGFIKAALSIHHGAIPPNLHFHRPNPAIAFDDLRLRVPTEPTPWPDPRRTLLAGVSAYGWGGTNCHVIVEGIPRAEGVPQTESDVPYIFTLSARSPEALADYSKSIARAVTENRAFALEDISHTLTTRTAHHNYRFACVASNRDELVSRLSAADAPEAATSQPLTFVFCGQGSQSWLMGRELLQSEPVFAETLAYCSRKLEEYGGWSLLDELAREESTSRLNETRFAQPAVFAIQVSLAALWKSWGIEPDAVAGHSMGEIAAACVAGALRLDDAVKVVWRRSHLLYENARPGRMLAAEMPIAEAESMVALYGGRLWIAAVNSARSVVISGEPSAVETMADELQKRDIVCRILLVDYASHGGDMRDLESRLVESLEGIEARAPRIPVVSTVTGSFARPGDFDAAYWGRNLKNPVRFAAAIDTLIAKNHTQFVEIAPHPVLAGAVTECIEESGKTGFVVPSLRRGHPERATLLTSLASLYISGRNADWRAVNKTGQFVRLPGYPFQRSHYWFSADRAAAPAYEVAWRELKPAGVALYKPRQWRIVMDRGGLGIELARVLTERGQAVVSVADLSCTDIVDLRGLDTPVIPDPEIAIAFAAELCGSVAQLLEAGAKIWLVTQGAEAVGGGPVNPFAAPLAGLARGLSIEHPNLWGGSIDLDPAQSVIRNAEALAAHLLSEGEEDQIALRGAQRYAPRLTLVKLAAGLNAPAIVADATYLITGGAGALGLSLAGWLADQGARNIVLTSRSGLAPQNEDVVRHLESRGVRVLVVRADVAETESMRAVFRRIETELPPLRGVFHAAGILTRHPLETLDIDKLSAVLRPKIAGSLVLHELTAGMKLDFFVFFSSGSSVWGSKNLAHYAAANRFLDSFAAFRRAQNLPALCINWGAWEGDSMASSEDKAAWAAAGVMAMPRAEAFEAMRRLLAAGASQAVVASVDWSVFKPIYEARGRRHLLDEFQITGNERSSADTRGHMKEKFEAAATGDRRELLYRYLRKRAAHITGFPNPDVLDPNRGFFDMGMDSMMTVSLRKQMETDFDCSLPGTIAFEHPTVNMLTDALLNRLGTIPSTRPQRAAAKPSNGRFAHVAESDLEALLAQRLETFRQRST